MTYTFQQNLVSSSKHSIKCPYAMTPKYVVCHNTANDAPATNEISYMISNNNQVSFHIAVDDVNAIQGLPLDRNAWACGDGGSGQGNRYGISVEICYSLSGGTKYTAAEENAVYVMARLLYKYNLGIDALKQHHDFATNGKNCPHRIRDEKRWDGFKGRVEWVLNEIKKGNIDSALESGTTALKTNSNTTSTSSTSAGFKVGDKVKVKTTATHYATSQSIKSFVKGSTYEVTRVDGNKLLLSDITSWVWDYDVDKVSSPTTATTTNSFLVKIICDELNIRQSASFDSKVVGTVKKGDVFTIVDEQNGLYKLKSGAGWISAGPSYVQKI